MARTFRSYNQTEKEKRLLSLYYTHYERRTCRFHYTSKYYDNSAVVGTNKAYAVIHQFGGNAGRNKKVEIPARPFLKFKNQDINQVIDAIILKLKEN